MELDIGKIQLHEQKRDVETVELVVVAVVVAMETVVKESDADFELVVQLVLGVAFAWLEAEVVTEIEFWI